MTVYRTIKTSGGSAPLKCKQNKAFIKTRDAPLLNVMPRFARKKEEIYFFRSLRSLYSTMGVPMASSDLFLS